MDFSEKINELYSKMNNEMKEGCNPIVIKELSDEMYATVFEYRNHII
jgi:hypothetical protein